MDIEIIKNELTEATRRWLEKANSIFGKNWTMPTISMNLRGGCAGRAYSRKWMIKYNPELYFHNKETFVKRTVPHELAHIISDSLHGGILRVKPHGDVWKNVMVKLGVEDIGRCHSYDTSKLTTGRRKPYIYTCGCRNYPMSITKHRRAIQGLRYFCRTCKKDIHFVGVES